MRRTALLVVGALCWVAGALPTPAQAHAVLVGSTPTDGQHLAQPPGSVVLHFSEGVEAGLGDVRVIDAQGHRVDRGRVGRPAGGDDRTLVVPLRRGLGRGAYAAQFLLVSADGHAVTGRITFAVGDASLEALARRPIAWPAAGSGTDAALGVVQAAGFAAIGLMIGTLVFVFAACVPVLRSVAGPRAPADARLRRSSRGILVAALGLGIVTSLLGPPLQFAAATGRPLGDAFTPDALQASLDTHFGRMWLLRGVVWALLGLVVLRLWERPATDDRPVPVAVVFLAVVLAATPGLAGHAEAQGGVLVLVVSTAHVLAMAAWLGGLAAIAVVLPRVVATLAGPARTAVLGGTVTRFSAIALGSVAVLAASGAIQALTFVGAVPDLGETAYGRAVVVKIGLLVVLVCLGAVQRRAVVPTLGRDPDAARSLQRLVRVELALLGVALAVTAALSAYAPTG